MDTDLREQYNKDVETRVIRHEGILKDCVEIHSHTKIFGRWFTNRRSYMIGEEFNVDYFTQLNEDELYHIIKHAM